jgi:uncharacterized protein YkwD
LQGVRREDPIAEQRNAQQDALNSIRRLQLVATVIAVLLIGAMLVVADPAPMPATAADGRAETDFVARVNSIRQSRGLAPLAVYGELTGIARGWTDHMAANGSLSHNGHLSSDVSAHWTKLGENVGAGSDLDTVMNAFVNSSAHYKNIVDPAYNYIGVGVSYGGDGQLFTTHDFMAMDNGSAPSEPAPAPAPRRRAPAPRVEPEPAPEPDPAPDPVPPTPPAAPERVHTMLAALRAAAGTG